MFEQDITFIAAAVIAESSSKWNDVLYNYRRWACHRSYKLNTKISTWSPPYGHGLGERCKESKKINMTGLSVLWIALVAYDGFCLDF